MLISFGVFWFSACPMDYANNMLSCAEARQAALNEGLISRDEKEEYEAKNSVPIFKNSAAGTTELVAEVFCN